MDNTNRSVLVGVFDDRYQAERAVDELEHSGYSDREVGFALRGADVTRGGALTDAVGAKDTAGAVTGAVTGGVMGGIIGAAAALVIPGVGPVLAAGMLATSLGYAGAGVAVGGIIGALTGAGLSEEQADHYQREFIAGKALVMVRSGRRDPLAIEVIHRHGGRILHTLDDSGGAAAPSAGLVI